jgi:hypothetical protein
MKLYNLFLISLVCLFFVSCSGSGANKAVGSVAGVEGVSIDLDDSTQIVDSIYNGHDFHLNVKVENNGFTKIDKDQLRIKYDFVPNYIKCKIPENCKDKTLGLYSKELFANSVVDGEFLFEDLGIFELDTMFISKLPSLKTDLKLNLYYPYSTKLTDSICIDLHSVSDDNIRKQICKSVPKTYTSQGAPIAIVGIEPGKLSVTDTSGRVVGIKPFFKLTIVNKQQGKGNPYLIDNKVDSCAISNFDDDFQYNRFKIKGEIVGADKDLVCYQGLKTDEFVFDKEGKASVFCYYGTKGSEDGYPVGGDNYESLVSFEVDYCFEGKFKYELPISVKKVKELPNVVFNPDDEKYSTGDYFCSQEKKNGAYNPVLGCVCSKSSNSKNYKCVNVCDFCSSPKNQEEEICLYQSDRVEKTINTTGFACSCDKQMCSEFGEDACVANYLDGWDDIGKVRMCEDVNSYCCKTLDMASVMLLTAKDNLKDYMVPDASKVNMGVNYFGDGVTSIPVNTLKEELLRFKGVPDDRYENVQCSLTVPEEYGGYIKIIDESSGKLRFKSSETWTCIKSNEITKKDIKIVALEDKFSKVKLIFRAVPDYNKNYINPAYEGIVQHPFADKEIIIDVQDKLLFPLDIGFSFGENFNALRQVQYTSGFGVHARAYNHNFDLSYGKDKDVFDSVPIGINDKGFYMRFKCRDGNSLLSKVLCDVDNDLKVGIVTEDGTMGYNVETKLGDFNAGVEILNNDHLTDLCEGMNENYMLPMQAEYTVKSGDTNLYTFYADFKLTLECRTTSENI